jgi:hypothetical protein
MRKLLVLLILGSVLWSGYWFAGSTALRQGVEGWFAQAASRGITAERTGLGVAGFPNRFDLTVEGLRLSDPASGTGWQAPFAQVFAMTWKPWHVIAAFPPDQVVTLPGQDVALQSDGLRASLRARPSSDLPLAMAVVESGPVTARSTLGWSVAADRAVLSLGAASGIENGYDIAVDIAGLAPDPALVARFAPEGGLPPALAAIKLRATARLTAPLDRHLGAAPPRLQVLDVTETLVTWGDVLLAAQGSLAPDDEGYAAGRIQISVTNWRRILPVLVASGAVRPELVQTVETMLDGLARQSGDPEVLKLPLILEDGWAALGPLPLGPAPLLLPPSG